MGVLYMMYNSSRGYLLVPVLRCNRPSCLLYFVKTTTQKCFIVRDLAREGYPMTTRYEENPQRTRSEPSITPLSPTAPIIGRQQELTQVMSHFEAVKAGHAH